MAWPRLLAEAILYEFPQKHAECRLGEALNKPIGLREFVMPYVVQGIGKRKGKVSPPCRNPGYWLGTGSMCEMVLPIDKQMKITSEGEEVLRYRIGNPSPAPWGPRYEIRREAASILG